MKRLLTQGLAAGALALALATPAAAAGTLGIDVYNPGAGGIFPVSSEIVTGDKEAALIDAQFSRRDALALVERIKATGKKLTTVYISHSDPDYYFGLQFIQDAFPGVKIVATRQTVEAIRASKDGKLAYWGPVLKGEAPQRVVVPEPLATNSFAVDGVPLQIVGLDGPAPERSFVWVPSNKAVLGGVVVVANTHVWVADTQTPASRRAWLSTLSTIDSLKPELVVPGHFLPDADGSRPFTLKSVAFTRDYLVAFENAAATADDAAALAAAMKARYPGLAGVDGLELGAKVIEGELSWPAGVPARPYPAAGKRLEVSFGDLAAVLEFSTARSMTLGGTSGAWKGLADTVKYKAVEVRPGVYMVVWHEPKSGANVVQVQDFDKGVVHASVSRPDGTAVELSGGLRILDGGR